MVHIPNGWMILLLFNNLIDSSSSSISSSNSSISTGGIQSNGIRTIQRKMLTSDDELIATTSCAQTRNRKGFNARVDFTYFYVFQYSSMNEDMYLPSDDPVILLLLHTMERAIATSVAATLVHCTVNEQYPLYAVDIASTIGTGLNSTKISKHIIVPSSYLTNYTNDSLCPLSNNSTSTNTDAVIIYSECMTARGMTSVLFNSADKEQQHIISDNESLYNGSFSLEPEMDWTFIDTLITATIQDVNFLNQFVLSSSILSDRNIQIVQTQYTRSIGKNIIILPMNDDLSSDVRGSTNETIKVAVIAAVLSFTFTVMILSLILCYCRCFQSNSHHLNRPNPNRGMVQKRRRRQSQYLFPFEPLDDDFHYSDSNDPSLSPTGLMVVTNHHIGTTDVNPSLIQRRDEQQAPSMRLVTTSWSDVTSDSESIMSSLHLDRIDEVDEEVGDFSYEQVDKDGIDLVDQSNIHISNKVNGHENIEISLKDDIASRPQNVHPGCTSLDFVTDWNVSYHNTDMFVTNGSTGTDRPCDHQESIQAIADLSIEISIDDEIILSNNDMVENIVHPFPAGIADTSFTFSSGDDSDAGPRENLDESKTNRKHSSSVDTIPGGHIYDADDFQSIEISVAWMDNEVFDCDNNEDGENVSSLPVDGRNTGYHKQTAVPVVDKAMPQPVPEVDESETLTEKNSTDMEKSIEVAATSDTLVSELTDSNKFMLQDSTESTMFTNGEQSFLSTDAYRSELEIVSYPTNVNESNTNGSSTTTNDDDYDDDDDGGHDQQAANMTVAHWARDVLMKLMSDSPKMLQCDRVKQQEDRDFDSVQSNE